MYQRFWLFICCFLLTFIPFWSCFKTKINKNVLAQSIYVLLLSVQWHAIIVLVE